MRIDDDAVLITTDEISLSLTASGAEGIMMEGTVLSVGSGVTLKITGTGFAPNSLIDFYVFSDPIFLGSTLTDENGNFDQSVSLPTDLEIGSHRFEATGIANDQSELTVQYEFRLIDIDNPELFQEIGLFDEPEESAKTIGAIAAVAAAVAAAGAAAGAAGAAGSAGGSGGSGGSTSTAHRIAVTAARGTRARFSSKSSDDASDDEIESLETSHDDFQSETMGWGDRLFFWRVRFMMLLDEWWPSATIRSAPISPFVSKLSNDGAYLRAGFGPVWFIFPALSTVFAIWALLTSVGPVGEPGTNALAGIMAIGMFDIFSGIFGMTIVITGYLLVEASGNEIGAANDIRFIIGLFSLGCGPSILATSIRTIRKPAMRKNNDLWERIADLAVGTFITGWMTIILIAVLSQYAAIGLKFETSSNKVATIMALAFVIRVILEETTARLFPRRLNKANPPTVPNQLPTLKWVSILNRAIFTVFLSAAFVGNCWQLWVGAALFTLPAVIDQFQDRFPIIPRVNRYLPKETPTLTIVEICIVGILGILIATIGAGPSMIRTGFMLFPIPPILITVGNALGRKSVDGKGIWYLEPDYSRWYRYGGIILVAILVYLSEIFGGTFPMFF